MKALVYMGPGQLEIQQLPDPHHDIVIKVAASGVCGTDLKTYLNGHHMFPPNSVLGHECYGQIASVAPHVEDYQPGDYVVVAPYYECGECGLCRRNLGQLCGNKQYMHSGCFAEYIAVSAEYAGKGLFKIAEAQDVYTLVEPLACVMNGLEKLDLTPDRSILVVGSGPMGTLFAIALASMGITVKIAEISEWRKKTLASFHFHVIDPEDVSRESFDQIILTVNRPELVQHYLSLVETGGNVLLFSGFSRSDRAEIDPYDIHYREVRLTGSFGYNLRHFARSLQFIERNKNVLAKLITHKYALEDAQEGFDLLKRGQAMKLILKL